MENKFITTRQKIWEDFEKNNFTSKEDEKIASALFWNLLKVETAIYNAGLITKGENDTTEMQNNILNLARTQKFYKEKTK